MTPEKWLKEEKTLELERRFFNLNWTAGEIQAELTLRKKAAIMAETPKKERKIGDENQ